MSTTVSKAVNDVILKQIDINKLSHELAPAIEKQFKDDMMKYVRNNIDVSDYIDLDKICKFIGKELTDSLVYNLSSKSTKGKKRGT